MPQRKNKRARCPYGPAYFRLHCGPIPYDRSHPHWIQFFGSIADEIVRSLRPRSVLDVGCGKGFLVECLRDRGVEAYGFDVSEYAIGEVRPDIQPYCWVGSVTDPIKRDYDLITCIEVLEHVSERDAVRAIRGMNQHTARVLFSSTPSDFTEPTHQNVRSILWWLRIFAKHPFIPDWTFDASFVATHAFLIHKSKQKISDEQLVLFARFLDLKMQQQKERVERNQALADKDVHIANIEADLKTASQGLRDKDVHIANIEADLKTASHRVAERDAELQQHAARLQELEENRQTLKKHLTDRTAAFEKVEGRLTAAKTQLTHYRTERETLENTVAWRLIQRFWSWNMRWLPFGTRRRKAYTAVARGLARLLFGLKVREEIPDQPASPVQPVPQPVPGEEKTDQEQQEEIHMNCDEPQSAECCSGVYLVLGWAVAPSGIATVEILLDGQKIGQAGYGQARPDVAADYPKYKDSQYPGFFYVWDSSDVEEGPHLLTISVLSKKATRKELPVPITVDQAFRARNRAYDQWIDLHEPGPEELTGLAREAEHFSDRPLVSVVVPVYRTPVDLLREAIESVRNQIYSNWELCLADDASSSEEITRLLTEYATTDERIKFMQLPQNQGIAKATNAALSLAEGEFVAFMDSDDTLAQDALYWVVKLLQEHRDADLIYSDEDKLDLTGKRCDPFFKPDWSPDLLLSNNYICHFLVVRRRAVEAVQGLRSEYDGSQDYDLVLRVTERTNKIHHIPRILYHWRASETSTAFSPGVRPRAHTAAQRALTDCLLRNKIGAHVEPGVATGQWRVRYEILEWPRVAVIMPTGGNLDLLQPCLDSVLSKTDYPNYEIVLVDNSRERVAQEYFASLHDRNGNLSYIDYRNRNFNFSALNNFAVRQTSAHLVLFLNDDITVDRPDWLTAMVEHGQRPAVGAVGAKLLFPSGLIQHAGVVMGIYENTSHAFKHLPDKLHPFFDFPHITRNCSAVTAACMLTKRKLFLELGGFNEKNLAVAFQDVDYCLRLCQAGYRVVYTPYAILVHHESVTKDEKIPNLREVRFMQRKWAKVIARDPYYSPNLTRKAENYALNLDSLP